MSLFSLRLFVLSLICIVSTTSFAGKPGKNRPNKNNVQCPAAPIKKKHKKKVEAPLGVYALTRAVLSRDLFGAKDGSLHNLQLRQDVDKWLSGADDAMVSKMIQENNN